MDRALRLFKHLLPRGRAWAITVNKKLRQFFAGLSITQYNLIAFFDTIYNDKLPALTAALPEWLDQFNLVSSGDAAIDRQQLAGAWILNEYQSPYQIQQTLQAAGFDVYVHEWWELPVVGSPVARDPNTVIAGGNVYIAVAGNGEMQAGAPDALAGQISAASGYMLVNNIDDGAVYAVPAAPGEWPYIFYIGGETWGDFAYVDASRQAELETLILRIKPTEQWVGMLVNYV